MINKENDTTQEHPEESKKDTSVTDVAHMDINCHILIKDRDTNEILLNKRG